MTRPEPPSTARTTKSTRIRVASMLKYWARPPHTPASWRLVRLRYNFRVESMAPPFASRTCNQLTVVASLLGAATSGNRRGPGASLAAPGAGAGGGSGRGRGVGGGGGRGATACVPPPGGGGGLAAAGEVVAGLAGLQAA